MLYPDTIYPHGLLGDDGVGERGKTQVVAADEFDFDAVFWVVRVELTLVASDFSWAQETDYLITDDFVQALAGLDRGGSRVMVNPAGTHLATGVVHVGVLAAVVSDTFYGLLINLFRYLAPRGEYVITVADSNQVAVELNALIQVGAIGFHPFVLLLEEDLFICIPYLVGKVKAVDELVQFVALVGKVVVFFLQLVKTVQILFDFEVVHDGRYFFFVHNAC